MAVTQLQIDLLNLSVDALKGLVNKAGLSPPPSGSTKLEYVTLLTKQVSATDLEALAADVLYAGQTSISWIRLGDGDEVERDALQDAILEVVGDDPFTTSLRPTVTRTPKVVEAKVREDGKIVLVFVVSKPVRAIVTNFETRTIHEDHFFLAVIRPEYGLVEVRSSQQRATNLAHTFLADLADVLGTHQTFLGIAKDELARFKTELGSKLHRYRGKDAKGSPIDIQDLYKAPDCDDLDAEKVFRDQIHDCVPVSVLWVFDYGGQPVTLQVSSLNGSVWFRSAVPEEVIDHVFEKLRSVKGF